MGPLHQWDIDTFRAINGLRSGVLDPIFWLITETGLGQVQLALILALGLRKSTSHLGNGSSHSLGDGVGASDEADPHPSRHVGTTSPCKQGEVAMDSPRWKLHPVALSALISAAISGLLRLPLMRIAERPRPSNLSFARPMESVYGNSSFPSGHTTTSFAIAVAVLLVLPPEQRKWGWGLLAWACLVAFSRVYAGVHFPTDVLGGALLGSGVASVVHLVRKSG